jgi:hypothetical protein
MESSSKIGLKDVLWWMSIRNAWVKAWWNGPKVAHAKSTQKYIIILIQFLALSQFQHFSYYSFLKVHKFFLNVSITLVYNLFSSYISLLEWLISMWTFFYILFIYSFFRSQLCLNRKIVRCSSCLGPYWMLLLISHHSSYS